MTPAPAQRPSPQFVRNFIASIAAVTSLVAGAMLATVLATMLLGGNPLQRGPSEPPLDQTLASALWTIGIAFAAPPLLTGIALFVWARRCCATPRADA